MLFKNKQTSYSQPSNYIDNSRKKVMLVSLLLLTALIIGFSLLFTKKSNKDSTTSLTSTGLSAFEAENISIQVPMDFEFSNQNGQYTFSSGVENVDGKSRRSIISIYPYSKNVSDLTKLAESTTVDVSGRSTGTSKLIRIEDKDALVVKSKKDSDGKYMQRMFINSSEYTWIVKMVYYTDDGVLSKNADRIFESFRFNSTQ